MHSLTMMCPRWEDKREDKESDCSEIEKIPIICASSEDITSDDDIYENRNYRNTKSMETNLNCDKDGLNEEEDDF